MDLAALQNAWQQKAPAGIPVGALNSRDCESDQKLYFTLNITLRGAPQKVVP